MRNKCAENLYPKILFDKLRLKFGMICYIIFNG